MLTGQYWLNIADQSQVRWNDPEAEVARLMDSSYIKEQFWILERCYQFWSRIPQRFSLRIITLVVSTCVEYTDIYILWILWRQPGCFARKWSFVLNCEMLFAFCDNRFITVQFGFFTLTGLVIPGHLHQLRSCLHKSLHLCIRIKVAASLLHLLSDTHQVLS